MTTRPSDQLRTILPAYRKANRLSLRRFSELLEAKTGHWIDGSGVYRLEQGQRGVGLDEAVAICRLLDIPLEVLLDPRPIETVDVAIAQVEVSFR